MNNGMVTLPPFVDGLGVQRYLIAEEGASYANRNGFTHYYVDGSYAFNGIESWSSTRIASVRRLNDSLNVSPIFHGNFRCTLSAIETSLRLAAVAYVFEEVEIAAKLHAPLIVHGGALVAPQEVKTLLQQAIYNFTLSLRDIIGFSQEKGVKIWVENLSHYSKYHPFFYIGTKTQEFQFIANELIDARFIVDIGHANVGSDNPLDMFSSLSEKTVAISLSDNNGEKDTHSNLGTGNIDFGGLIKIIEARNWRGVVVLETRGRKSTQDVKYLADLYQKG